MEMHEALAVLKSKGVKLTPQRQEVMRVLLNGAKHHSADEIYQEVKSVYPGVSFDTIYRTLHLLKEQGLVRELDFFDGCRRFEFNEYHHHHLVCLKCGKAEEISFCPVGCLDQVQAEHPDFRVAGHMFKIYGYCQSCQLRS